MRKMVLVGLFTSGCTLGWDHTITTIAPGEPAVEIESGTWFQGAPGNAWLTWPNAELCDDEDWFCRDNPDATMTVLSAACNGCSFVEDPTGKTGLNSVSADAIATVDGPISIVATLRFDATKATVQVTGTVTGDHEVALVATCAGVDSAVLSGNASVEASAFRECGDRRATDTIVLFPAIHTARSGDFEWFCTSLDGCGGSRQLTITPAAVAWGSTAGPDYDRFAIMPPLAAATTEITLSVPLATGELSTVAVPVPPVTEDEPQ